MNERVQLFQNIQVYYKIYLFTHQIQLKLQNIKIKYLLLHNEDIIDDLSLL